MNPDRIVSHNSTVPDLIAKRAVESPEKVYLYFAEKQWTYKELHETTNRIADSFKKLGLPKGSHVAILLPDTPEFLLFWFGAMKAGLVGVAIDTLLKADEWESILNESEASILCTTPRFRKMLDPFWKELSKIRTTIFATDEPLPEYATGILIQDFVKNGDKNFSTEVNSEDKACIVYPSGTTDQPEGVILSHGHIMYDSYLIQKQIDLKEEDTTLCMLPLFHGFTQIASVLSTMQAGASLVLGEKFERSTFIQTLKKFNCTIFSGFPDLYKSLSEMKESEGVDLGFLKACISGGTPLARDTYNKFETKFKAKILEFYGSNEGTFLSSVNSIKEERRIGSIGLPIEGREMGILGDDNNPLPDGEIGEIVISNQSMIFKYHKKEEESKKSFINGWMRTGDLGYRDRDGYYFYVGRKGEVIHSGGENIYPREIEEILFQQEEILDCAVVGLPDNTYGEVVAAFVVQKPGSMLTEKEIKIFLQSKNLGIRFPKIIEMVSELPRTSIGRIQKARIVEDYIGNQKLITKVEGHINIQYKWVYGSALSKFYNALRTEGKFYGIKCPKCGGVQCPPKAFCGICFVECTEFVELPNMGVVETFTTVYMEFPGQPRKPPYTYGYIKMDGSHTHIYHIISEIDEKDIHIGLRVEPVWEAPEKRKGTLYDVQYFKPIGK